MGLLRIIALISFLLISSSCLSPEKQKEFGDNLQTAGKAGEAAGELIPGPAGAMTKLISGIAIAVGSIISGLAVKKIKNLASEKDKASNVATALVETLEEKGQPDVIKEATKKSRLLHVSPELEAYVAKAKEKKKV